MSSAKKIESILNLIEISESNLRTAKSMLMQLSQEKGLKVSTPTEIRQSTPVRNTEEHSALEVVEGYFDGENMIGDNGKIYLVPQNYASKTQLVVGDRMKWILTSEREIFKLIQPVARERVIGTFAIEGDTFLVLVDKFPNPVKILKASGTYAMKQLGLQPGDEVAIYVPKDATPTWGAFINVVKSLRGEKSGEEAVETSVDAELDTLSEFQLDEQQGKVDSSKDYF